MHATLPGPDAPAERLRLWPAALIVGLEWIVISVAPRVARETMLHFLGVSLAPLLGSLALGVWWTFFSRAPRRARFVGGALYLVCLVGLFVFAHESMIVVLVVQGLARIGLWLLVVAFAYDRVPSRAKTVVGLVGLALAFGPWMLLRTPSLDSDMRPEYAWRWSPPLEQRLPTDSAGSVGTAEDPAVLVEGEGNWPGFRGPLRDSRVHGLRIATDWGKNPPIELWRRPVGPGWSSFTVVGGYLFTQEQRGDQDVVAAYRADDGEPIWYDGVDSRFFDAISGAGPRATPTFASGRLYTVTAKGLVRCHDAAGGQLLWSHDLVAELAAPLPDWGFSGSPVVVDDTVIVYAGNPDGAGLVGYDALGGEQLWTAPAGSNSYSSPHLLTLHETPQIVMLHSDGVTAHDVRDGSLLWTIDWPIPGRARMLQPLLLDGDRLLIGTSFGEGTRMVEVGFDGTGWTTREVWTSRGMKPYYNDFVAHDGHLYGFDTKILASIDLADGERNWKKGRYGHGQMVLLVEQGLLLVLTEQGDLALVRARPDAFEEIARIPVFEAKTWNHPVIVGDTVYVRNDREMAAYRLPIESR